MVNLKGLTAPLTEKIESLTELLQELIDDIKEQKIIQQKILDRLNVCKNKENNELSDNPDK